MILYHGKNNIVDFRLKNICPDCEGLRYIPSFTFDDGHISPHVDCICGDGTYIGALSEFVIPQLERTQKRLIEDINTLEEWIKSKSACKTCKGNRMKTLAHCTCVECGITGTCPWPG